MIKTNDLESRVLELRGKQYSPLEMVKLAKAESMKQVQEILDRDKLNSVEAYRNTDKGSSTYQEVLIHVVKLLRNEYHMNYRQIAQELDESEYFIFDVIRRNAVTTGRNNNYIKSFFTREEKKMRNEDMLRLNKEGKTFAEIGRIFFTSKQSVSQIFQQMGEKPISSQEALSLGIETSSVTNAQVRELEEQIKTLKEKLVNTQKQYAITKYYMNQMICELRVSYLKSLARVIEAGNADEETIKEYKKLHQALMRNYNTLVKENAVDTNLFKEMESIIPLLARLNVKVKE